MVINMNEVQLCTFEQLQGFLSGTLHVEFSPHGNDEERYLHIDRVLRRFGYAQHSKAHKGVLLAYLRRTTQYSRAQITRLVCRWQANQEAAPGQALQKRYGAPAQPFARRYTSADVQLLVEVDRATQDVCGPATVHLLRRAFTVYQDARFERLATLSVSHLYNLRKSASYQHQRTSFTKTRPVCNPIGVRKAPRPHGHAGCIRIDTVHQGDLDGVKGVYTLNAVDIVCQWEVAACVQGISEAFLLPALALILAQFPFEITGFHSDNGSEYC
jgi:hypothetical protein